MTLLQKILFISITLLMSCSKQDKYFSSFPESDLIAIEGMDSSFVNAQLYNDSMAICFNDSLYCDSATINFYEEQYHIYEDLFDVYHEEYSHRNRDDDHHHEDAQMIVHEWMMGVGEEQLEYMHNSLTFEMMNDLRALHRETIQH